MEKIQQILKIAIDLGLTPLNIVLVSMLYFIGAHSDIFPKFWGSKKENSSKPATSEQMEKLTSYYNHDTTALLTQIREHLSDVKEETRIINNNLQALSVTTVRLEGTIREWEKYGILTREPKK